MQQAVKTLYYIEKTKRIEGSYVEVQTVFIAEDKERALRHYHRLAKKVKTSFGLLLSEYQLKAEQAFFNEIMAQQEKLPSDFYRQVTFLKYRLLEEYSQ